MNNEIRVEIVERPQHGHTGKGARPWVILVNGSELQNKRGRTSRFATREAAEKAAPKA